MIRTGLDVLIEERAALARGRAVGLLCHAASVSRNLTHARRALEQIGATVVALFGPEHGIGGAVQDMEAVQSGAVWDGVPIFSLYGASEQSLAPRVEWLRGIDVLVIDLQDVGSRYYTYVWTAVLSLRACARAGVPVVLLDRPNPIGGLAIEGPGIDPGYASFVGLHDVPVRHGMSYGELVGMVCCELDLDVELEVVQMQGWRRELYFEQTGLPWVLPSPNMPTVETAVVYPGGCLIEATNLSEGRGTTRPFETLGAPWIDSAQLADALHDAELPGLRLRPLSFIPTCQKHAGVCCGGVQLHVLDRRVFRPLATGVIILDAVRRRYEQFNWRDQPYEFVTDRPAVDLLAGGTWLREERGPLDWRDMARRWQKAESAFARRRAAHLLYK